jgi:hypothetical protein
MERILWILQFHKKYTGISPNIYGMKILCNIDNVGLSRIVKTPQIVADIFLERYKNR